LIKLIFLLNSKIREIIKIKENIAEGFLFREKIDDLLENTESFGLYLFLFGGFIVGAVITLLLLMPILIK